MKNPEIAEFICGRPGNPHESWKQVEFVKRELLISSLVSKRANAEAVKGQIP